MDNLFCGNLFSSTTEWKSDCRPVYPAPFGQINLVLYSGATRSPFRDPPNCDRHHPGIVIGFNPEGRSAAPEYASTPKKRGVCRGYSIGRGTEAALQQRMALLATDRRCDKCRLSAGRHLSLLRSDRSNLDCNQHRPAISVRPICGPHRGVVGSSCHRTAFQLELRVSRQAERPRRGETFLFSG